nr:MAG TPA: TFIIB zinc-binding [Caudoviricetes sp.]
MNEVRLINATPLEKEMRERSQYIGRETTNECESTAECCADMVSEAPTIDPKSLRPTAKWIIVRRMADGAECKCGSCGRKEVFTTFDRHAEHAYCCRCGCKMEAAVGIEVRKNDDDAV